MADTSAHGGLLAKLQSLDFTLEERALLRDMTIPAGDDVEGFAMRAEDSRVHGLPKVSKEFMNGWPSTFKGSDEELQSILDWLGSLEAQE